MCRLFVWFTHVFEIFGGLLHALHAGVPFQAHVMRALRYCDATEALCEPGCCIVDDVGCWRSKKPGTLIAQAIAFFDQHVLAAGTMDMLKNPSA